MQDYFYALADALQGMLCGREVYLASFNAERSDFVRFNQARVRQSGRVTQQSLSVELVDGGRHARDELALSGRLQTDRARIANALAALREVIACVGDDPHFIYNDTVQNTHHAPPDQLPDTSDMVHGIVTRAAGSDLVGFLASGGVYAGFANSLGQRNWHEHYSASFDYSLYLEADRAVKSAFGGAEWDDARLTANLQRARQQLDLLDRPARTLAPGAYRAYLAPAALVEILELLSWGGFGVKQQRTRQSPLTRLAEGLKQLHPEVSLSEHTRGGFAPAFQGAGYIRPDEVQLVRAGHFTGALVSPRSAREFGIPANGALESETPQSLLMHGGSLAPERVLEALDTGLYINNLWYLNYSDRQACRMTGMTRFAAFWVERGEIVAPVNVMRFDDSLYRLLGERLHALTTEPELVLSTDTYGARSQQSLRLPGALVDGFALTL